MRQTSERGTVVIFAVGIVLLLGTLGSTMLVRSLHEHRLEDRSADRQRAFFLAEAGVDQALRNLQTPLDDTDDVLTSTLLTGTFQIEDQTTLSSSRWQVTAHGASSSEQRRLEAVLQLTPRSLFEFALFGHQAVKISGNATTDSYNSASGPYDALTRGHHGDVGTNSTSIGGITVRGGIFVDGQLAVGPNVEDAKSLVSGFNPAFVTGGTSPPSDTQDVISQPQPLPMAPVQVPPGLPCADLTVNGHETVTLGSGTHCYRNLTIEGGGALTASGPVTVYVTGELNARGNSSMGVENRPRQMVVMMSPSGEVMLEQVTLTGSTQFYGALYAPGSTIRISGNAEIFGSVIAQRVEVRGSAEIHYDEALTEITKGSSLYRTSVVSWREL